jgi:hypothetical protein
MKKVKVNVSVVVRVEDPSDTEEIVTAVKEQLEQLVTETDDDFESILEWEAPDEEEEESET